MKINKLIAKGLALGFLLNSLSILSYANTEVPNRYQTIEGEYITIDDSIEGNLEEIEIFGNTVQDSNNLEDIQSVGDLYVDKDGNPILDKQGREQYKIEIINQNKNLFDFNLIKESENIKKIEDGIRIIDRYDNSTGIKLEDLNLKPNTTYTSNRNYSVISGTPTDSYGLILALDVVDNKPAFQITCAGVMGNKQLTFTTPEDMSGYVLYIYGNRNSISEITNIQIEEGDTYTGYEPYKNNKLEILLPTQLQKVGDVADRLYWDKIKKRYVIEKNIHFNKINSNSITASYHNGNFAVRVDPKQNNFSKFIITGNDGFINNLGTYGSDVWTYVNCNEDYLLSNNISNDTGVLAKYAKDKDIYSYYYQLKDPILIETNITSKLEIPIYDKKTHIYTDSENGINPDLKVTIDRLPQIAKEAIAQAESDNSNHNIALARKYINMLPESSYKDQLQTQLSDIFSSDMVLDMKTTTSNLDIYIKSENILQMSLDTNSISFEDFSGIEDVVEENAVNVTINSSLPYQINAYLPAEIQNSDKTKTLNKSILNIKENSESNYKEFTNINEKVILKDNCSAGNQLTHGVDLKLAGGIAHEKDIYKATIKLEVEQK